MKKHIESKKCWCKPKVKSYKKKVKKKIVMKDENELIDEFCKKEKCSMCAGTGQDGEPNGYGCHPCDEYVWKKMKEYEDPK